MWDHQELQVENAKECARLGIISFDEAFETFKAIKEGGNDAIIKKLYARRIDGNKDRASECSGG